jgi:hypothetical protein
MSSAASVLADVRIRTARLDEVDRLVQVVNGSYRGVRHTRRTFMEP